MKKTMAAMAVVALMGAAGAAHAAGPVSAVATGTADLVFAASGTATVKITPMTGLMAGNIANQTKLADVVFTASAGDVAYRWTPGSATITNPNNHVTADIAEVTGKAGNKILLAATDTGASTTAWDAAGWWVPVTAGTTTVNARINKYTTATVAPDTYPVSMDAVVWQR
ncbi:hypothetical protein NGI13_21930 [Enterobacter asburiae]|uniref:hypothetical protein n=1 Tax=Enterobacter asburiae TaxID=61645 RepID=UPI002DBF1406|nr:hypothetical protein [Enterobacter asburiae]MEB8258218.1 hypothetical protein [Enterobacter asburiae]